MRATFAVVALVLTAVAATVAPAGAATARPAVPTCLIANTGGDGRFGHTLTCVELVTIGAGHAAAGRYSPDGLAPHTLTVTLEYRAPGRQDGPWIPLAAAADHGFGDLHATTRTLPAPPFAQVRACVSVGGFGRHALVPLCATD